MKAEGHPAERDSLSEKAARRLTTVSDGPLPAHPFQIAELPPEAPDHGRDGHDRWIQDAHPSVPSRFPDFNQAALRQEPACATDLIVLQSSLATKGVGGNLEFFDATLQDIKGQERNPLPTQLRDCKNEEEIAEGAIARINRSNVLCTTCIFASISWRSQPKLTDSISSPYIESRGHKTDPIARLLRTDED